MLTTKTAMESYYIIYLFFSILAVKVNLPALVLVYKSVASKNSNYMFYLIILSDIFHFSGLAPSTSYLA